MPHDFVKQRIGSSDLAIAVRQQEQLSYFTESSIQGVVNDDYITAWASRKYSTNDMFLNYVKSVFRTDNFLTFFKFHRNPIASAELINDRVKDELARVFWSENSYFKYSIRKENSSSIEELDSDRFDKTLFNAMLFNHNDIVVTLMQDINMPRRDVVCISNVVALESSNGVIHKIAYGATLNVDGVTEKGYLYMDKFNYVFMDSEHKILSTIPHDLGQTPADYISNEAFSSESDIVRKSIFSHARADMEEYVFLKTLLKMTEPNGVIPVTVMLQSKTKSDNKDTKGQEKGAPMSSTEMGGQQASVGSVQGSQNLVQPGTTLMVPINRDAETNKIQTDLTKDYVNFFHMPVEPLKYVEDRIKSIKSELLISLVGDFSEANESAQNELQVSKGYKAKEDKLRAVSVTLSTVRKSSDFKFLALANGKDNVTVDLFFGSDFFMESQEELYSLFEKSPNPIERENILIKSSMNRNKFNKGKQQRDGLLYKLQPYCSDKDFDKASAKGIDPVLFEYYIRFNYWIGLFEAQFGNIVVFAESLEGENSIKLVIINGLIVDIIKTVTAQEVEEINKEE